MDPPVWIYTRYVIGLAVVIVIAVLGLRSLYKGLTGDTSIAAITVPPWLLITVGMIFQIPLSVYIYLGFTTGLFEKLYRYLF